MELPPGPVYLFKHLHFFLLPAITVYLALKVVQEYMNLSIPTWIIVVATLLARPALTCARMWHTDFKNRMEAASVGAVLVPHVPEFFFTVARKAMRSLDDFPGHFLTEWATEYGYTFSVSRSTTRLIITDDPEFIKALLATEFESFEKGPILRDQMESLLGTGIFNSDGEMWKFHRALARPFFTRERISDFDIYNRNCDISLDLAQARLKEGLPIEFQDLVRRFSLDSACEFLFGHNAKSLAAGIPYPPYATHKNTPSFTNHFSNTFSSALNNGQALTNARTTFVEEWPLAEFWKDRVSPERKIVDDFTAPMMREALAKRESDLISGGIVEKEDLTLLSHLVRHTQDPKIIKDQLVSLLVAGWDTTSCLLTYSMYMLTQHPHIEKRLREEVFDKVGPTNRPTYDNMREMRYLRAFLNEVLRLYPPIPMNSRRSNKPVLVTPKGAGQQPWYIPADTNCVYAVINLHRRIELWGPDALKFDPDRFLDERLQKYLVANPFIFCPFNAGPRICIGQQLAYNKASFFLVRLFQRFTGFELDYKANIKPPADWATGAGARRAEKVHSISHLALYVKGGLWVCMNELET